MYFSNAGGELAPQRAAVSVSVRHLLQQHPDLKLCSPSEALWVC